MTQHANLIWKRRSCLCRTPLPPSPVPFHSRRRGSEPPGQHITPLSPSLPPALTHQAQSHVERASRPHPLPRFVWKMHHLPTPHDNLTAPPHRVQPVFQRHRIPPHTPPTLPLYYLPIPLHGAPSPSSPGRHSFTNSRSEDAEHGQERPEKEAAGGQVGIQAGFGWQRGQRAAAASSAVSSSPS